MKDVTIKRLVYEPIHRNKVEFWAITTIYVFALFSLSTESAPNSYSFQSANLVFNYYEHYFWPQFLRYTLIYLVFLLFNFRIVPRLLRKEQVGVQSLLTIAAFTAVVLVTGVLDTYYRNYLLVRFDTVGQAHNFIFQQSFEQGIRLLLIFGIYTAIKYSGLYLLANAAAIQSKYKIVSQEILTAFIVWMVSVFILLVLQVEEDVTVIWAILSLSAILLYCYSFYALIPKALRSKRPFSAYLLRVMLVLVLAYLPVASLLLPLLGNADAAFGISLLNVAFQLMITAPAIWLWFRHQQKNKEEVYVLQKELGRSNANLDFLRSQINPHFLFNALNTLYGTALQENSERTAQGIQMLGDMMRFMLHENLQEKILLSREIEYLRNYIDLQLLRTSASPEITIESRIEDVVAERYIAPMLLIPFVENAFKHGISLQHKSWIKISLHCDREKLYFDVHNSIHKRSENDPEKNGPGIGLQNVQQRLSLLYPAERHELMIRQTPEEYFMHLTLQL